MSQYDYPEDAVSKNAALPKPWPETRKLAIDAAKGDYVISKALRTFYRAADIDKGIKVEARAWWMDA